jgi:CDP-diacylglycerol--glycerol-3-phosphate 3-phosphatidyltransferase
LAAEHRDARPGAVPADHGAARADAGPADARGARPDARGAQPDAPAPDHRAARPREVKGLIAPILRTTLLWPYRGALWLLLKLRVRPNHLTVASLVVNVVVAVLLARGMRFLPGALLLLAGVLDVFDGAVARARGIAGPRGAWFDSVIDRVSDAVVLGALFLSLEWQNARTDAALALVALAVSLLVSHVRAEAEARGAKMGEGAFARAERFIVLFLGLTAPHALRAALGVLAALGAFTLLQRIWIARGIFTRPPREG